MNTGFYGVFKGKLDKHKKEIEKELERAKSDRRKIWLKNQLKETKKLRDLIKEMEKEMGTMTHCPHCGGSLNNE